ncbi:uncharacterized protein [Littorina saxatilis]|uniref:uncharacterized protein isoform X2 n=1 Tax=Littorina saxatilis TaxID=31220 RepID=UPI0038B42F7C
MAASIIHVLLKSDFKVCILRFFSGIFSCDPRWRRGLCVGMMWKTFIALYLMFLAGNGDVSDEENSSDEEGNVYVEQPDTDSDNGPTGKRALIPGSLPTNHVLQKSVETPKTPARKPPVSRPPPPAPDLVAYYNFEEIRQDTLQLAAPWCILENSKEQIQLDLT